MSCWAQVRIAHIAGCAAADSGQARPMRRRARLPRGTRASTLSQNSFAFRLIPECPPRHARNRADECDDAPDVRRAVGCESSISFRKPLQSYETSPHLCRQPNNPASDRSRPPSPDPWHGVHRAERRSAGQRLRIGRVVRGLRPSAAARQQNRHAVIHFDENSPSRRGVNVGVNALKRFIAEKGMRSVS